jgi:hypothetical protein
MKSPFPPKKFTLFYTSIILHDHIKSFKCIRFYIYIVLHSCVKSYKCIDFYTYIVLHGLK